MMLQFGFLFLLFVFLFLVSTSCILVKNPILAAILAAILDICRKTTFYYCKCGEYDMNQKG